MPRRSQVAGISIVLGYKAILGMALGYTYWGHIRSLTGTAEIYQATRTDT
jgi:hypothetical protein